MRRRSGLVTLRVPAVAWHRHEQKTVRKPQYDCAKCPGYCCSYSRIAVSDFDIERLARHFGLSESAARRKFTYHYKTKELDEQLLRHKKDHIFKSTCQFFDQKARRCTVYAARPSVCRIYPEGSRVRVLPVPDVRTRAAGRRGIHPVGLRPATRLFQRKR